MAALSFRTTRYPALAEVRCAEAIGLRLNRSVSPWALSPCSSAQNQAGKAGHAETHTTWRSYGGSPDGSQYSALQQIDRSNVKKLQIAWTYRTGDDRRYAFNPLVIDGTMYVLAKNNAIVAWIAATGKEIWTHPTDPNTTLITNRGIDYWENAGRSDRRLIFALRNETPGIRCPHGAADPSVRHQRHSRPACRTRT